MLELKGHGCPPGSPGEPPPARPMPANNPSIPHAPSETEMTIYLQGRPLVKRLDSGDLVEPDPGYDIEVCKAVLTAARTSKPVATTVLVETDLNDAVETLRLLGVT